MIGGAVDGGSAIDQGSTVVCINLFAKQQNVGNTEKNNADTHQSIAANARNRVSTKTHGVISDGVALL